MYPENNEPFIFIDRKVYTPQTLRGLDENKKADLLQAARLAITDAQLAWETIRKQGHYNTRCAHLLSDSYAANLRQREYIRAVTGQVWYEHIIQCMEYRLAFLEVYCQRNGLNHD